MGIFQNWFKSTPPSQPVEASNPAFDKLITLYEERIADLKATVADLSKQIDTRDAKILDLRKQVEMVPRMTTSQEIHDWNPQSINDQPNFDEAGDLKQIKADIERELKALMEEHLTTVEQ